MLIKAGVDISRLSPEIRRALNPASIVATTFDQELIITSTYEGNHSPSSKHYANDAFDFRVKAESGEKIMTNLGGLLGADYYVLFEGDHVHVHYNR